MKGFKCEIHFASPQVILDFYEDVPKSFDFDPANGFAISLSFGFFIFTSGFIVQPLVERIDTVCI
jgi:hypothetical protein